MQKRNVINLATYRIPGDPTKDQQNPPVSEELEAAIELLIDRLRDKGPLQQSGT